MQKTHKNKPLKLNLDKEPKSLAPDEAWCLLNYKSPLLINDRGGQSKGGQSSQFPANYPAYQFQTVPVGENYTIGAFYSQLTKETYSAKWNSNGINFIERISANGGQVVYSNNNNSKCFAISPEPRHALTQERAYLLKQNECANRGGKYFMFGDGLNEYFIDTEASIATNFFTTPYFQRCSNGCEFIKWAVPEPHIPPKVTIVPITPQERNLTNFCMDKGFRFSYKWGYYDLIRASIYSNYSQTVYQDSVKLSFTPAAIGRRLKIRLPIGNPLVDFIDLAVSIDGGAWHRVARIEKYKKYNNTQQMWYERELAELTGYSNSDCSFDYYFDNSTLGEVVDPHEMSRNFTPHPRQFQTLFNIDERIAAVNFVKGNCPLDKREADKFKVSINENVRNTVKGLKAGGTYYWGFVLHGSAGRFSFVYGTQSMNIPRTQDKNKYDFTEFFYDFTGMVLPSWVEAVSIVRTKNINQYVLQLKVDSVVRKNDRLYLNVQWLNKYNDDRAFKTNTKFQFVDNDHVEFIAKGGPNGIFTTAQYGLLNFKIDNPYFDTTLLNNPSSPPTDFFNQIIITPGQDLNSIPIGDLNVFMAGARIEVQRALKVSENPEYFEVATIPVVNGSVLHPTGSFSTFDTYLITRDAISVDNIQPYEHFAPNDFWPVSYDKPLSDQGRAWLVNRYENEKRFERDALLNYPGEYNIFEVQKKFPDTIQGGIVAVKLRDNKNGLAVAENDNFLFTASDDSLRLSPQGTLSAAPADSIISDPQAKISGQYGCGYEYIQSVHFGDGWATWVDANRHTLVIHDYSQARDAALYKANSYFRKRIQDIATFNSVQDNPLKKIKWITGYNPIDRVLMITTKAFRHPGHNNKPKEFDGDNKTILFDPISGDFLGFVSFTQDAYSILPIFDGSGCAFISYLGVTPYIHPILSNKCNEFNGVPCDEYFGISFSSGEGKKIHAKAYELQGDKMFFAKEVTTENPNFDSEIPPESVRGDGDKWNASFLCNKRSAGGLHEGEETKGYVVNVLFCRDNTIGLRYNSINNAKRTEYSYTDEIIFKFVDIEQSGFTQNL